jgi:hypothetical protein
LGLGSGGERLATEDRVAQALDGRKLIVRALQQALGVQDEAIGSLCVGAHPQSVSGGVNVLAEAKTPDELLQAMHRKSPLGHGRTV